MKKPSLKDIAKLANVSPSTVSFVLNGKAKQMRVSNAIAEKVKMVAEEHGYQPNQVAVSLRTGKSQMLGLIVESISGIFFASLARVVEELAAGYGYRVVYCATENDAKRGEDLVWMLSQRQVDGYIITPTKGMADVIQKLAQNNKPVVLLDSFFPDIDVPHVSVDNPGAIGQGMQYLISKGYQHIGFVTVDLQLIQMQQRLQAYKDSLKKYGLPSANEAVLTLHYGSNREEAINHIKSFIQSSPGLQVVFFATNYLGLLGLEGISQLGLKIPDDIAVISFDDHDVFRLMPPGITSIRQPIIEIGQTAMKLLMAQLNHIDMNGATKVEIPAELIIRGST